MTVWDSDGPWIFSAMLDKVIEFARVNQNDIWAPGTAPKDLRLWAVDFTRRGLLNSAGGRRTLPGALVRAAAEAMLYGDPSYGPVRAAVLVQRAMAALDPGAEPRPTAEQSAVRPEELQPSPSVWSASEPWKLRALVEQVSAFARANQDTIWKPGTAPEDFDAWATAFVQEGVQGPDGRLGGSLRSARVRKAAEAVLYGTPFLAPVPASTLLIQALTTPGPESAPSIEASAARLKKLREVHHDFERRTTAQEILRLGEATSSLVDDLSRSDTPARRELADVVVTAYRDAVRADVDNLALAERGPTGFWIVPVAKGLHAHLSGAPQGADALRTLANRLSEGEPTQSGSIITELLTKGRLLPVPNSASGIAYRPEQAHYAVAISRRFHPDFTDLVTDLTTNDAWPSVESEHYLRNLGAVSSGLSADRDHLISRKTILVNAQEAFLRTYGAVPTEQRAFADIAADLLRAEQTATVPQPANEPRRAPWYMSGVGSSAFEDVAMELGAALQAGWGEPHSAAASVGEYHKIASALMIQGLIGPGRDSGYSAKATQVRDAVGRILDESRRNLNPNVRQGAVYLNRALDTPRPEAAPDIKKSAARLKQIQKKTPKLDQGPSAQAVHLLVRATARLVQSLHDSKNPEDLELVAHVVEIAHASVENHRANAESIRNGPSGFWFTKVAKAVSTRFKRDTDKGPQFLRTFAETMADEVEFAGHRTTIHSLVEKGQFPRVPTEPVHPSWSKEAVIGQMRERGESGNRGWSRESIDAVAGRALLGWRGGNPASPHYNQDAGSAFREYWAPFERAHHQQMWEDMVLAGRTAAMQKAQEQFVAVYGTSPGPHESVRGFVARVFGHDTTPALPGLSPVPSYVPKLTRAAKPATARHTGNRTTVDVELGQTVFKGML